MSDLVKVPTEMADDVNAEVAERLRRSLEREAVLRAALAQCHLQLQQQASDARAAFLDWIKRAESRWAEALLQIAQETAPADDDDDYSTSFDASSSAYDKRGITTITGTNSTTGILIPELSLSKLPYLSVSQQAQPTCSSASSNSTRSPASHRVQPTTTTTTTANNTTYPNIPALPLRLLAQLSSRSQPSGRLETPSTNESSPTDRTDRCTPEGDPLEVLSPCQATSQKGTPLTSKNHSGADFRTMPEKPRGLHAVPSLSLGFLGSKMQDIPSLLSHQLSHRSSTQSPSSRQASPGKVIPRTCHSDAMAGMGELSQRSLNSSRTIDSGGHRR